MRRKGMRGISPGFGDRVKAAADLVGTRAEAAAAAGVSEDMLYRYIREECPPSFSAMAGLSHHSGVSLDWLATGRGWMMVPGLEMIGAVLHDIEQLIIALRNPLPGDVNITARYFHRVVRSIIRERR